MGLERVPGERENLWDLTASPGDLESSGDLNSPCGPGELAGLKGIPGNRKCLWDRESPWDLKASLGSGRARGT